VDPPPARRATTTGEETHVSATTRGGWRRGLALGAAALALAYAVLLLPERAPEIPPAVQTPEVHPFAWRQEASWDRLEADYLRARAAGCEAPGLEAGLGALEARVEALRNAPWPPDAPVFREVEQLAFRAAAGAAACPRLLPRLLEAVARLRDEVKRQSERWPPGVRAARETLYRVLYGSRAAVEEAILQGPPGAAPSAPVPGVDEPSATPSAQGAGVKVHSGDVLVSRGGAATSALIALGSDFPGNFSHVALLHVDPATHAATVVEAHIERGVTASTPQDYFRDRKLRVMVLRPRADLPALRADPWLPHRAAQAALDRVRAGHVPYDFAMDDADPSRLFCSEVAADAYRRQGVALWAARSHVSSGGLRRWLAGFGVRHFDTLEPSDLEYDPQLRVVAEWRDPETLRQDHLDDAATRAILDSAEEGAPLRHDRWLLPVARLARLYGAVLGAFGAVGPIPEGMSATAALRSRWYERLHARLRRRLEDRAARDQAARGSPPPSWRLARLAREELRALAPSSTSRPPPPPSSPDPAPAR
jgi:permuted papain-like amidase YaeF/Yiix C92 family enzyme